ncbi:MAG: secretin N-terminal domain-containing protein [Candidatus Eisenbacteria bacterium]
MKLCTLVLVVAITLGVMAPAAVAQMSGGQALVTIRATETPLVDVLDILSEKSGLNIVASTGVEGTVISISLTNTPVEEALNLIVRAAGLGYERVGNSILVAAEEVLVKETGLGTYVIPLQYADAYELVPVLEKMIDKVAADPGGNRLIIVATPGMIEQIRGVVETLDVPPVQILLETEVIEVSTNDLLEFGIDWGKITSQTLIFAEGNPEVSDLDSPPSEMPYGGRSFDVDDVTRQAKVLDVALDLLESEGKAKILTRAKLATLNNRAAEIHIGDVIPYTVTGLTTGGVYEVKVEKSEIGVSVKVTPRAAGDGHITVYVEPNVSTIVGFRGPNDEIPWTKERRVTTQVRVRDGETFMIAGLLSEDESQTVSKVPLLGDIPLLGYLFQHQKLESKNSDLIIKITPRIVK